MMRRFCPEVVLSRIRTYTVVVVVYAFGGGNGGVFVHYSCKVVNCYNTVEMSTMQIICMCSLESQRQRQKRTCVQVLYKCVFWEVHTGGVNTTFYGFVWQDL